MSATASTRRAGPGRLLADLDHQAALAPDRTVGSVFFGGGTPSLMPPETVAALLDRLRRIWPVAADVEITLEANPNSAEAERFRAFAAAGVNRLSLGVQALDPAALRFLGRAHDRAEAIAAIEHARDNFPRFSFDLIYARPGQTAAAWRGELDEALSLAGEHLSLYQLTIEPGTAFATLARARRPGPARRRQRGLALRGDPGTARRRRLAGLRDLQPRPPRRRMPPQPRLLALSGLSRHRPRRARPPDPWRRQIARPASAARPRPGSPRSKPPAPALEETLPIARDAAIEEMLMMGLRLTEGIARRRLEQIAGQTSRPGSPAPFQR